MSKFVPNSTQVPNILFDELMVDLSGSEFKCLCLIIRKTRGWHKEVDSIAISQFLEFTGIKKPRTIHSTLSELVNKGWICVEKLEGRTSKYSLSDRFNQCPSGVVPINGTSTHQGPEPVPIRGTNCAKTSAHEGHPQKKLLQNTNIQKKDAGVETPSEPPPQPTTEKDSCPYKKIVELYHQKLPMLPEF